MTAVGHHRLPQKLLLLELSLFLEVGIEGVEAELPEEGVLDGFELTPELPGFSFLAGGRAVGAAE